MTQTSMPKEKGDPVWKRLVTAFDHWRYQTGIAPGAYAIRAIILLLLVLFFGLPIIWLFIAPTKTHPQLLTLPALQIGNWGHVMESWTRLANYNRGILFTWIKNSIWYVSFGLVLVIGITVPAGYLLANVNFKGRKLLLWATLIIMLLPGDAIVLPMYMEMFNFKLINSPWSVILPAGFAPMAVYLTFTFYKAVMPRDIIDAARVDGCSDIQMFWHIGLPLAQSVMAMLLFTQFSAQWNGFFQQLLFLDSDQLKTLPVGLYIMALMTGALNPNPTAQGKVLLFRPDLALASIITVLPVILIFLVSQRLIVRAATAGAIQGE